MPHRRHQPPGLESLGGGVFGDGRGPDPAGPRRAGLPALLDVLDRIAERCGVSRTVIALAWLLKHPSRMVPIVGSINPDRIRDATRADGIDMSRDDWYRILVAARMKPLP